MNVLPTDPCSYQAIWARPYIERLDSTIMVYIPSINSDDKLEADNVCLWEERYIYPVHIYGCSVLSDAHQP